MYQSNNIQSPCAEYLYKIQMIVSNSEFKNKELANKYETTESRLNGEKYVRMKLKQDSFNSYEYDDKEIYQALLDSGYPEDRIYLCLKNPYIIPPNVKKVLLDRKRAEINNTYVEMNKYYCNLAGLPFQGSNEVPADRILTIPDDFFLLYAKEGTLSPNQPVHTLSDRYVELFMNSKYYTEMLETYKDAEYLRHIGSNAIPIEVSRKAKDGELMFINTNKLSGYHRKFGNVTVSPDIVHLYSNTYSKVRDYVYNTLRGNFSSIYPNYNDMIRFLTIYMSIGQTLSELMKQSSSMMYLNNASANNYFMLYGLPSVIMEGQSMINFLKQFRLLLMDKGTNVVYRVKDFIGYKYTDINSLIMVKQQVFVNGVPQFTYDEDGNATPMYNIVFRRLGTTADKSSYFQFKTSDQEYDWREIASGDPRWWWWNDPEIDSMLYEMNYTLSNSKYIQLSTHMSMADIYWQSIILLRGLLDNKSDTNNTPIMINYDVGTQSISVFDAVLALVIIMNWNTVMINGKSFNGNLYKINSQYNSVAACLDMLFNGLNNDGSPKDLIEGLPFKIASFNFDIKYDDFYKYELPTYDYLDPSYFIDKLLKPTLNNETKSVGLLISNDVRKIYDYLVDKLLRSRTIHEFRQVTTAFNKLFLVDPIRKNWYSDLNINTMYLLETKYNISEKEIADFATYCSQVQDNPEFKVTYKNIEYTIKFKDIMNTDVRTIEVNGTHVFDDNGFVNAYYDAIDNYDSNTINISKLSNNIKNNYKGILKDKVLFDINTDIQGPESFESLLMINNSELYSRLLTLKSNGTNLVLFMRAIIKGLETYTASTLSALEYSAIGGVEYINILKEVISYFKSYMVEFTKDEFAFVMDGLFDNGGNSNMLRLYDEITNMELHMQIKDSIALYDISNSALDDHFDDDNKNFIYDDAIIRNETTYQNLKQSGYDIWFDDGNRITKNEPETITDDSIVLATLVSDGNTYRAIIPVQNIENE